MTRCPACVYLSNHIVRSMVQTRRGTIFRVTPVGERNMLSGAVRKHHDLWSCCEAFTNLRENAGKLQVHEQYLWCGVAEDIDDFFVRQPPIGIDENSFALGCAEEHPDRVQRVFAEKCDPITGQNAITNHGISNSVTLAVELLIGRFLVLNDESSFCPITIAYSREKACQRIHLLN